MGGFSGKKSRKLRGNGLPHGTMRCLRCGALVAANSYDDHYRFCEVTKVRWEIQLPPALREMTNVKSKWSDKKTRRRLTDKEKADIKERMLAFHRRRKDALNDALEELQAPSTDDEIANIVICYPEVREDYDDDSVE
jgi:hypothetical protein